jgi:death on curing protein
MRRFVWVLKDVAIALHDKQIFKHGGLEGVRDIGGLESALKRPQFLVTYKECEDIAELAAAYAYGVIKNHPFLDGNKRTAFVTAELFLALNRFELVATDDDSVMTFLGVASGSLSEKKLIEWYQVNIKPL